MIDALGSVLSVLTFAVAALGSISLLVGAVGIFTIMTIAVRERTSEIGLLRALGAERDQVLALFLFEAMVLSLLGGLAGLARRRGHRLVARRDRAAAARQLFAALHRPVAAAGDPDRPRRRDPARAECGETRPCRGLAGRVTAQSPARGRTRRVATACSGSSGQ